MLDEMLISKQAEVEAAKGRVPLEDLKARVASYLPDRSFRNALARSLTRPTLIAELKRKSPSKGMLRERFDPVSLAQTLQGAGAGALSVLTDESFFGGQLEYLRDVKHFTEIPVLRKDFIIDPYQVYEAAFYEADAVLLIVRVLAEEALLQCMQAADRLGIEPLVEVHAEGELKIALSVGAHVIGINHRDLQTFQIDLTLSERLIPKIPKSKLIVVESGIASAQDVQRLARLGVHGLLIGESLMTTPDPAAKIRELFAGTW